MESRIFEQFIKQIRKEQLKNIIKESVEFLKSSQYSNKLFNSVIKKIENIKQDGKSILQHIYFEIKEDFKDFSEEINMKEIIDSHINQITENILNSISEKLDIEDIDQLINLYRSYLSIDYEEFEDEEIIEELCARLVSIIKNNFSSDSLEEKIGEDLFNKLLSIIVIHGLKVNKLVYEFSQNLINKIELNEKLNYLYNTYILTIVEFIKENPQIKEYAYDILQFAIGNKAGAILSIVSKITLSTSNKFKNISEKAEQLLKKIEEIRKIRKRAKSNKKKEQKSKYETN
ncbi:hypothetical protein [Staphylococcus hominis]|uniref:hypothetical protein n=1 Tax=Staphylococcus hominis TaxID=1290 RepID=UPI0034CDF9C2